MLSHERKGSRALVPQGPAEGEQRDSHQSRLQCWKGSQNSKALGF